MKKRFAPWLTTVALTFVAAITTGCPGETPPPPEADIRIGFDEAMCAYYFADGTDMTKDCFVFGLVDSSSDDKPFVEIEFYSDTFEDVVSALPATGTYNFSASGEKFAFGNAEYTSTVNTEEDEEERGVAVTGGKFTIDRNGLEWRVYLFFELEDGKTLEGTYTGEIYQVPVPKENVTADFNDMDYPIAGAGKIFGDAIWTVLLLGENADDETVVILNLNTEPGLTEIPTGTFPMAAAPRKGEVGTAEPFSWLRTDDVSELNFPPGCIYTYESQDDFRTSYAVPNAGSVEISAEGEEYTIEFSFTGPNGKTVSGSYTGGVMNLDDLIGPPDETRAAWRGVKRIDVRRMWR
jgi:hypothetical protein